MTYSPAVLPNSSREEGGIKPPIKHHVCATCQINKFRFTFRPHIYAYFMCVLPSLFFISSQKMYRKNNVKLIYVRHVCFVIFQKGSSATQVFSSSFPLPIKEIHSDVKHQHLSFKSSLS